MNIKLSIITVTFNSENVIKDLIETILKSKIENSEIVIVDCASTDKTIEIIKKYPEVKLIESKVNLGYARGNNLGVKNSKGKYILFLNPDVRVPEEGINRLLNFYESNEDMGAVSPKLVFPNGKMQKSVRKLPTLKRAFMEYFLNKRAEYDEFTPSSNEPVAVECIYTAVFLMSRSLFESIKGFDEKYFLYYEDIDLCKKIIQKGKKIYYYPEVEFTHELGHSKVSEKKLPLGIRTLALFTPIKTSGKMYYLISDGNIYHGVFTATLIRLIIYVSTKLK